MEDVNYYEEWLGPKALQEQERLATVDEHLINFQSRNNENGDKNSTDYSDNNCGASPTHAGIKLARIPKRGRGPPSTVVCNHIGWIEVMALIMSPLHPGFTPKSDFIDTPLLGTACRGLQSLFISRGGDDEAKQKIVEQIMERQHQVEVEN